MYRLNLKTHLLLSVLFCVSFLVKVNESIRCYKCLSLDCDEEEDPVCQSIRTVIVRSLQLYYESGNYVPPCPDIEETSEWLIMQQSAQECTPIPEIATCSLGRLQINTTDSRTGAAIGINHATMLGCMTSKLLQLMKAQLANRLVCNYVTINKTASEYPQYIHSLEMENCPKPTDYCKTQSFCVPFTESIVKPFLPNVKDKSFEAGGIIAIIAIILVVILVIIAASFCKNPLRRPTNYSPAQVQKVSKIPVEEL